MSINIEEDIIDVFLLFNNKKFRSVNNDVNNYYRIIPKDIGVKDTFKELTFEIVNNIQLTINIKFKNKYSTISMSVKDRLKFFNQQKEIKIEKPIYIPKKLKIPNFFQETQKEKSKKEYIKKIQENNFNKQKEQKKENKNNKEIQKSKEAIKKVEISNKEEINSDENAQKDEKFQNNVEIIKNEEVYNAQKIQSIIFHFKNHSGCARGAFMKNIYGFGGEKHGILIKNILENIHLLFEDEKDTLFFHYDNIKIEGEEVTIEAKVRIEDFDEEPKYFELKFIFNFKSENFTKFDIKNYKYKEDNGNHFESLKSTIKCQCNLKLQNIFYKYAKILYDLNATDSFYNFEEDYYNRLNEVDKEVKALEMPTNEIKIKECKMGNLYIEVNTNSTYQNLILKGPPLFLNPHEFDLRNNSLDFLKIFDFGQHILVDEKLCYDRLTPCNISKLFIAIAKKISSIFGQFAFFRINEFKYLDYFYYKDYNMQECSIYISILLYLFEKEYYMSFEFRGRLFYLIYFCEVKDAKELNLI